MMLLGGGATARCGTVRHGDDVTGQLVVAHSANQSNQFFFSVVKFGISIGLFSTRHPFNIVLE